MIQTLMSTRTQTNDVHRMSNELPKALTRNKKNSLEVKNDSSQSVTQTRSGDTSIGSCSHLMTKVECLVHVSTIPENCTGYKQWSELVANSQC